MEAVRSGPWLSSLCPLSNFRAHPPADLRLSLRPTLHIRNCALQCIGQVDVEEWPVERMHDGDFGVGGGGGALAIGIAGAQGAVKVAAAAVFAEHGFVLLDAVFVVAGSGSGSSLLCIFNLSPAQVLLVLGSFCCGGGGALAAEFRDGKDGLPALEAFLALRGRVTEAGAGERAFGPAIVDAGQMPVYFVWSGVAVELVANINKVLDGGYVDVVDGREV